MAKTESISDEQIAEIVEALADICAGDTIDEDQATAILRAKVFLRAANSDGGVEPIPQLYRWREKGGEKWRYSDVAPDKDDRHWNEIQDMQPLFAHPPAKALDGIVVNALAWGVLDMDGEALHSVHIFKELAEKAAFGLGSVVPLSVPEINIKPLEWVVDEDRICLAAYALGMTYRIIQLMPGSEIWLSINGERTEYQTEDEAKAAAQADFEQRIRSALK